MENSKILSSESEKEYNSVLTDDFVQGLLTMPGVDGKPGSTMSNHSRKLKNDDNFPDHSKEHGIVRETSEEKAIASEEIQVLSSESSEYGVDGEFIQEMYNIDIDNLRNSNPMPNKNPPHNNKQKPETITDTKPKACTIKISSNISLQSRKEDNNLVANKKRPNENEVSGNAAVITPNKAHRVEGCTIDSERKQNNVINTERRIITETLLTIRNTNHDYILEGDNSYLNKLILSLEIRYFRKGKVVNCIPIEIKELNRKVSKDKKIYYESYKNRETFIQKVNMLKKNKKSQNPYCKEYSILQNDESRIPLYDEVIEKNCSDLNRTLYKYYTMLREWMNID